MTDSWSVNRVFMCLHHAYQNINSKCQELWLGDRNQLPKIF